MQFILLAKHKEKGRQKWVWKSYGLFDSLSELQSWASWRGILHYRSDFYTPDRYPIVVRKYENPVR